MPSSAQLRLATAGSKLPASRAAGVGSFGELQHILLIVHQINLGQKTHLKIKFRRGQIFYLNLSDLYQPSDGHFANLYFKGVKWGTTF